VSKRPPKGTQTDTISRYAPQVQESFDLNRLDAFVTSLGVDFLHYRAIPSPLGQNDRGELRRSDGVDQITSNGMIYRLAGQFTATMTDNQRRQKRGPSGVLDPSEANLVMPRFYNIQGGVANGERIYMAPGDRVYLADANANDFVANSQKMDYQQSVDNEPMFPIVKLLDKIVDSQNIEYVQGVDFVITMPCPGVEGGNIRWLPGGKNPGIDVNTGKGRIYSIVYLYKAFYYIVALPKEVRVTNVTTDGVRAPERMAYNAVIVREFIFHQRNRGNKVNQLKPANNGRTVEEPQRSIDPASPRILVDMTGISTLGDDEDQS
jgi:hypothetical protein